MDHPVAHCADLGQRADGSLHWILQPLEEEGEADGMVGDGQLVGYLVPGAEPVLHPALLQADALEQPVGEAPARGALHETELDR